ncbi:MAG: tripartite tricarboxylate transporter TctB family protein [Pseudomonadota bacterium]
MDKLDYKAKIELGVALVIILIGAFFIYQSSTISASREAVGPRTMPMFLASSLIIGGIWVAIRALLGKAGDVREGYGFLESNLRRIFQVIGCGVFFVIVFWAFGYFTAIFTTFMLVLYAFGNRGAIWLFAGGIIVAFIFQWLFMGVMLLNDPRGALVDMRPYTNWITGAQ